MRGYTHVTRDLTGRRLLAAARALSELVGPEAHDVLMERAAKSDEPLRAELTAIAEAGGPLRSGPR